MTPRIEFDDQLRAWADLGDDRLPVEYLKAALAQVDTTPQRRARPGWWRFPTMNRFATRPMIIRAGLELTIGSRQTDREDLGTRHGGGILSAEK